MPKVKIDSHGISIELDAGEASIKELGEQALDMYQRATQIDIAKNVGAAVGFSAERRGEDDRGHGTQWHQPRTTS